MGEDDVVMNTAYLIEIPEGKHLWEITLEDVKDPIATLTWGRRHLEGDKWEAACALFGCVPGVKGFPGYPDPEIEEYNRQICEDDYAVVVKKEYIDGSEWLDKVFDYDSMMIVDY